MHINPHAQSSVSRRDFWRILYQLLRERVTIFVSTAYLDEAERCNRVGLLNEGKLLACGTPDEVKQLVRGTIYEIRASEPRKASLLLRETLEGDSVGLFGDRVHVVTNRPDRVQQVSRSVLAAANISLNNIRVTAPSLEDVFISVLDKDDVEAEKEG